MFSCIACRAQPKPATPPAGQHKASNVLEWPLFIFHAWVGLSLFRPLSPYLALFPSPLPPPPLSLSLTHTTQAYTIFDAKATL